MRSRKAITAVAMLAVALALPSAAAADTVTVGKKQAGKTIRLDRGDALQIKLTENPSTGYAWRATTKPSRAVLTAGESHLLTKERKDSEGHVLVGTPGTRVFSWKAKTAGSARIVLKLFGPGSPKKAASTLTYRVTVR